MVVQLFVLVLVVPTLVRCCLIWGIALNLSNAIDDMNSKLRDRPFSANVNVLSCNNVMIVGQFSLKLATCRTPKHYRYGLSSFRG